VQRRTLYVARAADVAASAVICGLASPADDHEAPRLLPPGEGAADLVLAVADGTPRNPLTRRRNPARATAGLLRRLVWHKFGVVFTALLAVIGVGFGLLATRYSLSNALYLGLMDLTGSALTSPADSGAEKTAQVVLTLDGMAFIPVSHVLLIADVRAGPGLAGRFIADTEQDGQARVLALQAGGAASLDWSPRRGYPLADGDRMIVLATREGLGPFLSAH
jgi:hypothetical protein